MHIVITCGTRPDFVKLAPLILRAKKSSPEIRTTVLHTGQHYDPILSEVFFRQLGVLPPDVVLPSNKGDTHGERFGSMLRGIMAAISGLAEIPTSIIALGDTNSTLAAAVAATQLNIQLVHVESGLRSHDLRMPEESNRVVCDHVSDVLFATEDAAVRNLLAEGVDQEIIQLVGNLGIETFELFKTHIASKDTYSRMQLRRGEYLIATIHRHEHVHNPNILRAIFSVLSGISQHIPVVLPLHPHTRRRIEEYGLTPYLTMRVIEPLGYIEFMNLVMHSHGVITDSGGIQEETSHLGIPCATLRDNTERPITIERGSNRLFPSSALCASSVKEILNHLERTDFAYGKIPMWDARVSERIIKHLIHLG